MSHYDALGVPRDADDATIKAAHRKLAREHHPDQGGNADRFKAIQSAYDTLRDPEKRAYYDRTGGDAPRARSEFEELVPLVVGAFDRAIVEALGGGANPSPWTPPRGLGRTDIVKSMVRLLEDDKKRGSEANKQIAHECERMHEMQRRLGFTGAEGKNILTSTISQRLRDAEEQTTKNNAMIATVERAIEHVSLYGWEVDPEPEMTFTLNMYGADMAEQMRLRMMGEFAKMPMIAPGTEIKLAPARKRRTAQVSRSGRPHTVRLDDEGKQVPRPRGSWAAFAHRAEQIREAA